MPNNEKIKRMRIHLKFIAKNYSNRNHLTGNRLLLYNGCLKLHRKLNKSFSTKDIEKEIGIENFCNKNQPQDYCYNSVNLKCYTPKFLLKIDKSLFEFKNIDWKPDKKIKVTWKPKGEQEIDVGTYSNNGFNWSL